VLMSATRADAFDPRPHALLADLQLQSVAGRRPSALEAYVARALAPRDPLSWRRWAYALYWNLRMPEASAALERYFALAPRAATVDAEAVDLRARLKRMQPGGDLVQRAIREERVR